MNMTPEAVADQVDRLWTRSGLPMHEIAKRMGYASASSIQRYKSPDGARRGFLPEHVLVKMETALVGVGNPPITAEDIWALGAPRSAPRSSPTPNASFPPRYQKFPDETVPLLGQTVGGPNGRFILNGQEISRVFCPPDLAGVDGAYAVQVYGTSMEPKFEAGETVWLHPWTPVRSGDYVVAQILTQDGEPPESYIKQFVSQNSKVLRLKQFNPEEGEKQEMEFPADRVFSVHKIVFHALV